ERLAWATGSGSKAGARYCTECPSSISALALTRMRRLRVMTYNIHRGRGFDRKVDLGRVADVIASYDPDVVTLQEVDVGRQRSGCIDQPTELAKRLGLDVVFAPNLQWGDGEHYGIATLTRLPI